MDYKQFNYYSGIGVVNVYVIIMGGGRLGLRVALDLIADNIDVSIIEKDENICKFIATKLDTMVICGSGTDRKTLENAEINEADVFFCSDWK